MNEVTITPYDVVDYLESQEDIDMYLEEAFATGDYKHIKRALANARRAQKNLGLKPDSQAQLAARVGFCLAFMPVKTQKMASV